MKVDIATLRHKYTLNLGPGGEKFLFLILSRPNSASAIYLDERGLHLEHGEGGYKTVSLSWDEFGQLVGEWAEKKEAADQWSKWADRMVRV